MRRMWRWEGATDFKTRKERVLIRHTGVNVTAM